MTGMAALIALPPPADTLGGRIRQARRYRDLKQDALGPAIGVTRETIGNWETGKTNPTVQDLIDVARQTGFPIAWFVDGLDGNDSGPDDDDGGQEPVTRRELATVTELRPTTALGRVA